MAYKFKRLTGGSPTINGEVRRYRVKSGESVEAGDFVSLLSVYGNASFTSMSVDAGSIHPVKVSDGICVFFKSDGSQYVVKLLLDEVNKQVTVLPHITVVTQARDILDVINISDDTFLFLWAYERDLYITNLKIDWNEYTTQLITETLDTDNKYHFDSARFVSNGYIIANSVYHNNYYYTRISVYSMNNSDLVYEKIATSDRMSNVYSGAGIKDVCQVDETKFILLLDRRHLYRQVIEIFENSVSFYGSEQMSFEIDGALTNIYSAAIVRLEGYNFCVLVRLQSAETGALIYPLCICYLSLNPTDFRFTDVLSKTFIPDSSSDENLAVYSDGSYLVVFYKSGNKVLKRTFLLAEDALISEAETIFTNESSIVGTCLSMDDTYIWFYGLPHGEFRQYDADGEVDNSIVGNSYVSSNLLPSTKYMGVALENKSSNELVNVVCPNF